MSNLNAVDTFETTPLGQALVEAGEIRKEITSILEERRQILGDEKPDPMALVRQFAAQRMALPKQIARTE